MEIQQIRLLSQPLVLATPADVKALESELWIILPEGYLEFITTLGEGILGGRFVRVYPPWKIQRELANWRARVTKYWFWDKAGKVLPKDRALECVLIGDTMNGDELVFHPTRPGQLFVLPRASKQVHVAGSNLLEAVDWMCGSGKLTKPFAERDFEPFDSRNDHPKAEAATITDPEGETLDELVALAKRWSERHGTLKSARSDLKGVAPNGGKAVVNFQALVLEARYPLEPGYLVELCVEDSASRLEVGTYRWYVSTDSRGCQYAPNQANLEKLRGPE